MLQNCIVLILWLMWKRFNTVPSLWFFGCTSRFNIKTFHSLITFAYLDIFLLSLFLLIYWNNIGSYCGLNSVFSFQPFLHDGVKRMGPEVQHVILCSGKIYHELARERNARNLNNRIAIGRVEQIHPFPISEITEYVTTFSKAKVWWAQQEQFEDGWWSYIQQNLKDEGIRIKYAGRCHATRPDYGSPLLSTPELSYIFDMMIQNPQI